MIKQLLFGGIGKWIALGILAVGGVSATAFCVQDYVRRGVVIESLEQTQEQDNVFREQVERLTESEKKNQAEIEQAAETVEKPDEIADPWLVRFVKRLLNHKG